MIKKNPTKQNKTKKCPEEQKWVRGEWNWPHIFGKEKNGLRKLSV